MRYEIWICDRFRLRSPPWSTVPSRPDSCAWSTPAPPWMIANPFVSRNWPLRPWKINHRPRIISFFGEYKRDHTGRASNTKTTNVHVNDVFGLHVRLNGASHRGEPVRINNRLFHFHEIRDLLFEFRMDICVCLFTLDARPPHFQRACVNVRVVTNDFFFARRCFFGVVVSVFRAFLLWSVPESRERYAANGKRVITESYRRNIKRGPSWWRNSLRQQTGGCVGTVKG